MGKNHLVWEDVNTTETLFFMSCHFKKMPTQSNRQNYNSHAGLNNIHTDVISSQHSLLLYYATLTAWNSSAPLGVRLLLLFPFTLLDRETHSTWLNSHKHSAFLSICLSVHSAAGGWR